MDSTTHAIFAARRRREKARLKVRTFVAPEIFVTSETTVSVPTVRVATCRHCGDPLPEEGAFRGYCGMGCAGDDGYLKSYRD